MSAKKKMKPVATTPDYWGFGEASKYVGVARQRLYAMAHRHEIEVRKVAGQKVLTTREVQRLLGARRTLFIKGVERVVFDFADRI